MSKITMRISETWGARAGRHFPREALPIRDCRRGTRSEIFCRWVADDVSYSAILNLKVSLKGSNWKIFEAAAREADK